MSTFLIFQNTEEKFDKKIVNERIARLSGGITILEVRSVASSPSEKFPVANKYYAMFTKFIFKTKWQVGAQTQVELKDKKLRIEDALNAARVSSAFL